MYGTCARTRVTPENRDQLQAIFESPNARSADGFVTSYVLAENDSDTVWLFAVFADKASYDRNADDPAQHEEYLRYRPLMEEEPEWHDGEIRQFP